MSGKTHLMSMYSRLYHWYYNYSDEETELILTIIQAKAAIPALRKTKGRIVLCSSGAATKAYATWGCYGATKIALNHIAMTLAREEPDITTVAIRPGVVDTQMQSSMAELHHSKMEQEDAERFKKMKADGKMLRPEQPGNVMAELAVRGDKSLSGKFLRYCHLKRRRDIKRSRY